MTSTPQEKRAYENLLCDAVMALSRKGVNDPNVREILAQLKTLNQQMTPAKGLASSGAEKALAGITVAERKRK